MTTIITAIVAAMGCSVSVETNSPTAPRAARPSAEVRADQQQPPQRLRRTPTWVPDSVIIGPAPNRAIPTTAPATATTATPQSAPMHSDRYLTTSSRVRWTGTVSR